YSLSPMKRSRNGPSSRLRSNPPPACGSPQHAVFAKARPNCFRSSEIEELSMKPLSVVVAQSNGKTAEMLAQSLYNHFRVVNVAGNLDELRFAIPRHRADVVIVDLELAPLSQVQ